MTFFYDLNKRLQQVLETPKSEHKQLNEGAHSQGAMELNPDFRKKQPTGIMGKIAKGAKKVADFVAPGDEDLLRDLERRTGGRRPMKEAAKPDFLDLDKDGNKKEPMKKAAADKKSGAKQAFQKQMGGSAADLTKGLSVKKKSAVKEGTFEGIDYILSKYPREVEVFKQGGELDYDLESDLWDYYFNRGDIRNYDADASEYIAQRLADELGLSESAGSDFTQDDWKKVVRLKRKLMQADPSREPEDAEQEAVEILGYDYETVLAWIDSDENLEEVTKEIPGGRRHTAEPGGYGRRDDDDAPKPVVKKGRGRPKKGSDSETGEVMKPDWSAFGVGKVNLPKHKGAVTKHKMVGEGDDTDVEAAIKMLKKAGYTVTKGDEEPVTEKAVSKKQQRFMGMVHAAQKGEKPASKEVAKVAREMPKKETEKFAKTKHKGLPDKVKEEDTDTRDTRAEKAGKRVTKDIEYDEKAKDGDHGKKRGPQDAKAEKAGKRVTKDIEHDEKVDETTTSGSVATAPAGGKKSSGGFNFGGGIYDSMNRDLENMISESMARLDESMNISMNMNSDSQGGPAKSLTITATDDDADKLAMMLKMAGLGGEHDHGMAYADAPDMVDENKPDWPTNTETSDDAFQYSGGLNKPKTDIAGDGQSTGQVTAVSTVDKDEDDELNRMMEMAGVKKKAVDEEKTEEGNKFTGNLAKARADGKKEADLDGDGDLEKVDESIFASTANLWKTYKG
jgi:hypothetical protein